MEISLGRFNSTPRTPTGSTLFDISDSFGEVMGTLSQGFAREYVNVGVSALS
jgi:hypothetical protein